MSKSPASSKDVLVFLAKGFTLVELLVVVAIISVISSLILVNWNNFREIRILDAAGQETVSQLREVRSRAINGEKPSALGCASFDGYQIEQGLDNNILVVPYCNGNRQSSGHKTIEIDSTITGRTFLGFPIMVQSVTGVNSGAGSIALTYNGRTGTVIISSSGDVRWQRD